MIRSLRYTVIFSLVLAGASFLWRAHGESAPASDEVLAVVFDATPAAGAASPGAKSPPAARAEPRLDVDVVKGADFDARGSADRPLGRPGRGVLVVYDDAMLRSADASALGGPAAVVFLDHAGTVLDLTELPAGKMDLHARSSHPARYTVLLPAEWLASHPIKTGARASFVTPISQISAVAFPGGKVTVELARTPGEIKRGLMFRDTLAPDAGMLFIFPTKQRLSFWMRNTKVPLSIAFLDEKLTVLNVDDMEALDDVTRHLSHGDALYALEVNKGWLAGHHVAVGQRATLLKEVREVNVRPGTWTPPAKGGKGL